MSLPNSFAPSRRRILDLSVPLEVGRHSDPPPLAPRITYEDHADTMAGFLRMLPGATADDFPDGQAAASEVMQVTTHNGTHMDAPWHYHATMNAAFGPPRRSATIDEIPLEWCFQPGVKLDFRHLPDGHVVSAREVEAELDRIGCQLQPLNIVVINTAAGAAYGSPTYLETGCGMGREATLFLLERGVRVAGTDGWSWDAPFSFTAQRFAQTGDAALLWEGHKAGRDIGYCHMEKLHGLERLPPFGFMISCFPHKVKGGSAGWTRAVAIFDEEDAGPLPGW